MRLDSLSITAKELPQLSATPYPSPSLLEIRQKIEELSSDRGAKNNLAVSIVLLRLLITDPIPHPAKRLSYS